MAKLLSDEWIDMHAAHAVMRARLEPISLENAITDVLREMRSIYEAQLHTDAEPVAPQMPQADEWEGDDQLVMLDDNTRLFQRRPTQEE